MAVTGLLILSDLGIHCVGGGVGPTGGQDALEKRQICYFAGNETAVGRPAVRT